MPSGLTGEHEAAHGGSEREPDLPREGGERHVAAEQPGIGEIGDERRLHRAVDALADPECRHHDGQEEDGEAAVEGTTHDRHTAPSTRPRARRGARAYASAGGPPTASAIGSWASDDDDGVHEEDRPRSALSDTPISFFAKTGRSSKPDMPAKMNSVLRPTTPMNARSRNTVV